ncbi:MAG: retropepsin-like domain-containing protein [Bacteroidales bacterium]|nr:retropepsin-like domain-containing protein [Bacteroidales bacterium]
MRRIIELPIHLVEIEDGGYHLFVEASVNKKPVFLLVDTGASKTVFDAEKVKKLLDIDSQEFQFELSPHKSTGLGTSDMESHLVVFETFELKELCLADFQAVVLPMEHVNLAYSMLNHREIDGVLGSDILTQYKAVIYYGKRKLKLYQTVR